MNGFLCRSDSLSGILTRSVIFTREFEMNILEPHPRPSEWEIPRQWEMRNENEKFLAFHVILMKPEVWEPSFKCCTILTPVLYLEQGASSDTLWSQGKLACFRRVYLPFSPGKIKPGKGNGTSLQYSCLENPRDGGAWWAAVYGVTQSRTRLKWLSSSSSSKIKLPRSTSFVLKIQSWFPTR